MYGAEFLDLFHKVAYRSLLQPSNARALQQHDVTVALYSDALTIDRAVEMARGLGPVEPHVVAVVGNDAQMQQTLIYNEIRRCIDDDATFVLVPPDDFWGDGSLANLLATAGAAKGICVAVPSVRVDKGKFLAMLPPGRHVANDGLVWLALKTLHPAWQAAFSNLNYTSSFLAGISITRLSDNLFVVSHLLPSVFIAQFIEADYTFFREAIAKGMLGVLDHHWPNLLVRQGRQRVVGSSDLAFIAEPTDVNSHNVELTPNNLRG